MSVSLLCLSNWGQPGERRAAPGGLFRSEQEKEGKGDLRNTLVKELIQSFLVMLLPVRAVSLLK